MDKFYILTKKIDDLLYIVRMLSEQTDGAYHKFFQNFQEYLLEIKNKSTTQDLATNGISPGLFKWLSEADVMPENKELWSSVFELDQFIKINF